MKVAGSLKPGARPAKALTAIVAVALTAAIGAGLIPVASAFAQIAEVDTAPLVLPPAQPTSKVDGLHQPTGIDVEAQEVGTRTPTNIPKPASKPAVKPASRASASPAGDGWRQAKVSWYGPGFYGNTMAGGGTLQPDSMVVAHKSLPFGTRIEFQYRGRTCVAVVKDRGPYVAGRVFDLGPGTAKALGFSGVGTVDYRIVSQ